MNADASARPAHGHQSDERESALDALFDVATEAIAKGGVKPRALGEIERALADLAAQPQFFGLDEFPPSKEEGGIALYQLRINKDESLALYLNVLQPGKQSKPHNHKTWAAIAAVEGEELNRVYRRRDDGANPQRADLAIEREVVVRPGTSVSFMPEDIHSIHGQGEDTIRHLHMYGHPLEKLSGREGFDLQTGEVVNYNKTFMTPSIIPAGKGAARSK